MSAATDTDDSITAPAVPPAEPGSRDEAFRAYSVKAIEALEESRAIAAGIIALLRTDGGVPPEMYRLCALHGEATNRAGIAMNCREAILTSDGVA